MRDGNFAQELVLGGDDDADGIAGDVRTPGGEALEGDEVAGLDEGDEGALLVDTPHLSPGQAPLIGFREWVVIIYGSDDMMEIEGVS